MNTPRKEVRAIIFDLDGVLINSKDVARFAFNKAYEEIVGDGNAPPFSEYCQYFGLGFPDIMRRMALPVEMFPVFVRESSKQIHRIKMFDGIRDMLAGIRAHDIAMAIATGKDGQRTRKILAHLNISHYFQVVLGFDQVRKPKPDPEMADTIMRSMNVTASETLFIGDAIADLECGRRAGTRVGLACWDNPSEEVKRYTADFRFESPCQVVEILNIAAIDNVRGAR